MKRQIYSSIRPNSARRIFDESARNFNIGSAFMNLEADIQSAGYELEKLDATYSERQCAKFQLMEDIRQAVMS